MDLKHLFLQEASLEDHFQAQRESYSHYTSLLLLLMAQSVDLSHGTKSRVLAAFWARRDYELAEHLLSSGSWGLPEILKALRFLDAGRECRALEKRLERIEGQGSARASTLGQLRSKIHALREEPHVGTLSGALARRLRRWVRGLSVQELERAVLGMPHQPWRELSDLIHLSPEDFQLSWFLPMVYGASPPKDTVVFESLACAREFGKDAAHGKPKRAEAELLKLLRRWDVPYSFLRLHFPALTEEARAEVARYESLDTLLWYYEELSCDAVARTIQERLEAGEAPGFGYGKLVERLLAFKASQVPFQKALIDFATRRLGELKLPLESPVVVLGDASSSMDAAIRVSTILGSLLAAITGAQLHFFESKHFPAPTMPRDVDGVLQVVDKVRAQGCTSPAAALAPFYNKREMVRYFLVVTDEEENTPVQIQGKRYFFVELLEKYRQDVYPAKVAFISFLSGPHVEGQMVKALEAQRLPCLQFRLNRHRPDLTKTDALLGLLASESAFFSERAESLAAEVQQGGWKRALWALTSQDDGGQRATLQFQIQALRDAAFSGKGDRQVLLARLSKLHHLAQQSEAQSIALESKELLQELASMPEKGRLPEAILEQVIAQSEIWEVTL